jgi:hypothetical protein
MAVTVTASTITTEQARALGRHHGYNAANYAANVSGEEFSSLDPARTMPLRLNAGARMYYLDGYSAGIDDYQIDDIELDWPDPDE